MSYFGQQAVADVCSLDGTGRATFRDQQVGCALKSGPLLRLAGPVLRYDKGNARESRLTIVTASFTIVPGIAVQRSEKPN